MFDRLFVWGFYLPFKNVSHMWTSHLPVNIGKDNYTSKTFFVNAVYWSNCFFKEKRM